MKKTKWLILSACWLMAYGSEGSSSTVQKQEKSSTDQILTANGGDRSFHRVNSRYLTDVKPIFQSKCFDCHSNQTRYPWYYKVPLVSHLIDDDISEGREHLDLSDDFPFRGSTRPRHDLEEIAEVVEDNEMPPRLYRLMHWESSLTQKEREKILDWVQFSLQILKTDSNSNTDSIQLESIQATVSKP